MKNLSVKARINIWFSAALIIVAGITVTAVLLISNSVIKRSIKENLAETIENNVDEIEFYNDYSHLDMDDDYDIYLEYKGGYIEIDDDFIKSVNGIKSSIYSPDGTILYGENPIYKQTDSLNFKNGEVRQIKNENGEKYYVYDREIVPKGAESLWIRGTVSSGYGLSQINSIAKLCLLVLPVIVIIAVAGGYIISKRALAPIEKMSASAESIREGNDLSKRIEMPPGKSELHSLAASFNSMLDRLQTSFEFERQLTSDISHELRTPVSVILSQCELTLDGEKDKQEYIDSTRLILRQSGRLAKMINDMLTFARLERREYDPDAGQVDFSQLITAVCEDMSLIKEKGITIHYNIEPEIKIKGDTELLSRLAVNLISNAYRYGRENGNIYVTLSEDEKKTMLSVRDDGIGIKESDIDKIWNRFYRADSSRSEKGTGLGLNFVKETARIHGGEMSVQSVFGEGSTFTFTVLKK